MYFSEELKAVKRLGYKIIPLRGYEFSKQVLFDKYINDFYLTKKFSKGSERFMAKLMLNSLYGIFGRKRQILTPSVVETDELYVHLTTKSLNSIVEINDKYTLLLEDSNIDRKLMENLNLRLDTNITSSHVEVKANVAYSWSSYGLCQNTYDGA